MLMLAAMLACSSAPEPDPGPPAHPVPVCPDRPDPVERGRVESGDLVETSGLAASTRHPVLWAHNDSGDSSRVFAVGPDGTARGQVVLAAWAARDWEDIALDRHGGSWLVVGDIGDNRRERETIALLRFPEPEPPGPGELSVVHEVQVLRARYPDGPRNAETVLADPRTGHLLVATKEPDGVITVLRYPPPLRPEETVTLEPVATVDLSEATRGGSSLVTGGDISPDGDRVALRTYTHAWTWSRPPGTTVAEALAGPACALPLQLEPQGESLALGEEGAWTTSEGEHPPLWWVGP